MNRFNSGDIIQLNDGNIRKNHFLKIVSISGNRYRFTLHASDYLNQYNLSKTYEARLVDLDEKYVFWKHDYIQYNELWNRLNR
jgi:hypothetical protein